MFDEELLFAYCTIAECTFSQIFVRQQLLKYAYALIHYSDL